MGGLQRAELKDFYERDYQRNLEIVSIPKPDDFMFGQVIRQLLPYLNKGSRVLDLGCNTGNLSLFMARRGCEVVGIDLAQNAIDCAVRSAEHHGIRNVRFECIDFQEQWSLPDEFDLVFCSHVIEHVPHDEAFLKKICYALKPGGRLLLMTPTKHSSMFRVNKFFTGKFKFDEEVGHLRRYTRTDILSRFSSAGLTVSSTIYLDSFFREWVVLCKPLRRLTLLLSLPYVRSAFNNFDAFVAPFLFPATICVHAKRA